MKCRSCNKQCRKKGKVNGKQRWKCMDCNKSCYRQYKRKRDRYSEDELIEQLNAENVGIRGIARLLDRSPSTISARILKLSKKVKRPIRHEFGQEYELDEVWAKTSGTKKGNPIWIIRAINRKTKEIVDVVIGRRKKENMRTLIRKLEALHPRLIRTDKWSGYKDLFKRFPFGVHKSGRRRTNKIERQGLTLRCHLKRLNRRTISYTRNVKMLEASVLLYMKHRNWCLSGLTRK